MAKPYHSPGRIAISFISGLWLGWGFPYQYKWVGPETLKGRSAMVVVDHSIVKATYSPHFLLNAYKHKHNTNYKATAALKLHKFQDNFGGTGCYKREKPKTQPAKRGR